MWQWVWFWEGNERGEILVSSAKRAPGDFSYSPLLIVCLTTLSLPAAMATGHVTIGHAPSGLEQLVVIWGRMEREFDLRTGISSPVLDPHSIPLLASRPDPIYTISNSIHPIPNTVTAHTISNSIPDAIAVHMVAVTLQPLTFDL